MPAVTAAPTSAATLFGDDAPKRRAPKLGRETTPDGRPKAWIANPTELSIVDIEQGLSRQLGRLVVVEKVSSDPDETTVAGIYGGAPFTIRANPGEDLPAVLRRLTAQLRGRP